MEVLLNAPPDVNCPTAKSLLFVTGKVTGVILSSRVMSSSLEESEDFLAFLFFLGHAQWPWY